MRNLETIWTEIVETFESGINAEWSRCCLYKEAKDHFTSTQDFGEWFDNIASTSRRLELVEKSSRRAYMILAATYFTQQEFRTLGSSKVYELLNRVDDFLHYKPVEWRELVDWTMENMVTVKELRAMVKELGEGMPKKPKVKKETAKEKTARLESEVSILQQALNVYQNKPELPFSFSEHEVVREAQYQQLRCSEEFVKTVFGMSNYDEEGYAAFKREYTRLSRIYHTDRGDVSEAMVVLNEVKEATKLMFKVINRATQTTEPDEVVDNPFTS